jgi:uncharacterized phage protein (TIGR01671 family)
MRDIKFRAWDSENQKMVDVYAIDWASDTYRPTSINYPQGKLYDAPEDFGGAIKLMQYTGLKDKNGVEIYEGDIVRSWSENDGENILTAEWYAYPRTFASGFALFDSNKDDDTYIDEAEIIGNIYENPELVK